jgi:predicted nucleotidyltransferase
MWKRQPGQSREGALRWCARVPLPRAEKDGMSARPSDFSLQTEIEKLIRRVVSQARPLRIVLFGSFARGDSTTSSHLDLCIIVETDEDELERSRHYGALTRLPELDVVPWVFTPQEFDAKIARKDPRALRIVSEGKILYERE